MNPNPRDLEVALSAALSRQPDCPSLSEIAEVAAIAAAEESAERSKLAEISKREGEPARVAALRAHAATCPACAAELELAAAFHGDTQAAEAEDVAWIAQRARQTPGARVLPMRRRALPVRSWGRLAAAALVVLGVGLVFQWTRQSSPPALPDLPPGDVLRSGQVDLEAPLGTVEAPPRELRWRPVPEAVAYRIEMRDVAGDLLWEGESKTAALTLPETLVSSFEPFVSYAWSVTALDGAGRILAQSAPESFRFESGEEPATTL